MKNLLISLSLLLFSSLAFGQNTLNAAPYSGSGATVPASCSGQGTLFFKTSATRGWYWCNGGSFTAFGTGSGSGTVTSIATTSPITGGTITGTGTIACTDCLRKTPGADQAITGAFALSLSDAASSFVLKGVGAIGGSASAGSISSFTAAGSTYGQIASLGASTLVDTEKAITALPKSYMGSTVGLQVNPSADISGDLYAVPFYSYVETAAGNAHALDFQVNALIGEAHHRGTGTLTALTGLNWASYNDSSGTVNSLLGAYIVANNAGSGHVLSQYGLWIDGYGLSGGTTDKAYALYVSDYSGEGTNPYYSWFDSRGVHRCKEDATFNSVGQSICALYNPQFAKYTPGATDFERIISGQWSSNVAQIGTEKGGTGTLRRLQLLGSDVLLPSGGILLPGSSSGTATIVAPAAAGTPTLTLPIVTGTILATGSPVSGTTYATTTNCAAVGTAANPSVASCSAAASGAFSCATNASAGTCTVNTTAVTANSRIMVTPSSAEGTNLSVTCNTAPTVVPAIYLASKVAATSFTINAPTFTTNPACFVYWIVN